MKITNEVSNPSYTYDPALLKSAKPGEVRTEIRPGPNNPVGTMWLGLSKPHWGIHGTPTPARIGDEETDGCIHLTNWDAARLSALVRAGFEVDVQAVARRALTLTRSAPTQSAPASPVRVAAAQSRDFGKAEALAGPSTPAALLRSPLTIRYTTPAAAAPSIGATQNSQSCAERPAADEQRRAGAARRIHRGVGHRDADQVDQRQAEADRDRREAARRALVGGAEDDHQEEEGHHDLGDERRGQRVAAGRMRRRSRSQRSRSAQIEVRPCRWR